MMSKNDDQLTQHSPFNLNQTGITQKYSSSITPERASIKKDNGVFAGAFSSGDKKSRQLEEHNSFKFAPSLTFDQHHFDIDTLNEVHEVSDIASLIRTNRLIHNEAIRYVQVAAPQNKPPMKVSLAMNSSRIKQMKYNHEY